MMEGMIDCYLHCLWWKPLWLMERRITRNYDANETIQTHFPTQLRIWAKQRVPVVPRNIGEFIFITFPPLMSPLGRK